MEFTPFTVIAGANASGKSNLFDALKLLSRLATADNLKKVFMEQRGDFIELFSQYGEHEYAKEMEFYVEMLIDRNVRDAWGNNKELKYSRLRYELKIKRFTNSIGIEDLTVTHEQLEIIKHKNDKWMNIIPKEYSQYWIPSVVGNRTIPYITTEIENEIPTVSVHQDGTAGNRRHFPLNNATRTVLSSFDTIEFPHVLAVKEEMKSWKFLELNPEDLRQPSSKHLSDDVISQSGKYLASALYRIKQADEYHLKEILRQLQSFVPNFTEIDVLDDKENKQYLIILKDKDKKVYSSRVLSEGTLRILALCIMSFDDKHSGLLCFEEPENGIHPFRIEAMAKQLKELSADFSEKDALLRQVIVNTHSPVFVGCINEMIDKNVSIRFAKMTTRVKDYEGKRVNLSITSILPVIKEDGFQYSIDFSELDKKLTISMVKEYLETTTNIS
jgi:predicted ATPase